MEVKRVTTIVEVIDHQFHVSKARFCDSALVCTLAYLQDKIVIRTSLKPGVVGLDSSEDIGRRNPGPSMSELPDAKDGAGRCIKSRTLEYPASPQALLDGGEVSGALDRRA